MDQGRPWLQHGLLDVQALDSALSSTTVGEPSPSTPNSAAPPTASNASDLVAAEQRE